MVLTSALIQSEAMILDWLRDWSTWLTFDGSQIWAAAFYALMLLLASGEAFAPGRPAEVGRRERWAGNLSLGVANIVLIALLPISSVMSAEWAHGQGIGLLNQAPEWVWTSVVLTLLARSLTLYAIHVLMHKLPALWRVHRVHHFDVHMDVSTSLRSHPAEILIATVIVGAVSIGLGLTPWVLMLYELVEGVFGLMSHANFRLPEAVDRPLRLLFVTPNMHCIHHSSLQPETDSNYGGVLSIWDRMFRTYSATPAGGYTSMQLGLTEIRDDRASDFLWQLASPLHGTLESDSQRTADARTRDPAGRPATTAAVASDAAPRLPQASFEPG